MRDAEWNDRSLMGRCEWCDWSLMGRCEWYDWSLAGRCEYAVIGQVWTFRGVGSCRWRQRPTFWLSWAISTASGPATWRWIPSGRSRPCHSSSWALRSTRSVDVSDAFVFYKWTQICCSLQTNSMQFALWPDDTEMHCLCDINQLVFGSIYC